MLPNSDDNVVAGAASADSTPPTITRHTPEFHGRAGEFFSIWIVNLVLTVLTLGIYSAWAKVRTHRYLYANTRLAGASFEYLADPITILKGRLIAYAVVLALAVSAKFQIFWIFIPLYLVLLALFPLIIYLGIRFRARYSAWRGIRFRFDGTAGSAYFVYMLLPILSVFTLYLLIPYVVREQQNYMIKHHGFGGRRFGFHGVTGEYFPPFLIAIGLGIVLIFVFSSLVGVAIVASGAAGQSQGAGMPMAMLGAMAVLYAGMIALTVYVRIRFLNLMWNNTRLGDHRFESKLQVRQMLWLYLSNGVVILVTLGLGTPWAMIRMTRYRLSCLTLVASGSLDDFVASANETQSAAGAEIASALDLDLDIAL